MRVWWLLAGAAMLAAEEIPSDWRNVMNRIRGDSLRGHVSFLASDLLEGRDTPSRGLDVAAEYIAAQFARAGLETGGNRGYFHESECAPPECKQTGDAFVLRNVVGVLRGSDPELRESYIVVSAHYDHVGIGGGEGDRVFNGANDNASGTAAVIEIADAMARLPARPRRSIVFAAFAGEEKGLQGSREFLRSAEFAVERIAANVNLEVLGRTDTTEGPHKGKAVLTGFTYTTMAEAFVEAGRSNGVEVYDHAKLGNKFFSASDNFSFARKGIPSHTLAGGILYPDYHRPGDHWDKLDYEHLESITRTTALAVLMIATRAEAPKWTDIPETERFRNAARGSPGK